MQVFFHLSSLLFDYFRRFEHSTKIPDFADSWHAGTRRLELLARQHGTTRDSVPAPVAAVCRQAIQERPNAVRGAQNAPFQ
jgi:hypothetical protein